MRLRNAFLTLVLAMAAIGVRPWLSDAQVSPSVIEEAIARTVLLETLVRVPGQEGKFVAALTCTGSFISPAGLILTASHCVRATEDEPRLNVRKGEMYDAEGLFAVSINVPDQVRPVLVMLARYVADEPKLDLAIVKVHALLGRGGLQQLPPDFRAPFIPLGDSDKLRHGEPLAVIGFPGVGGETVTSSQGFVTGFIPDEQNRKFQLKLEAATGPGGSGGPVINAQGEEIAVLSGARVIPQQGVRSIRATLTNRIPEQWLQSVGGGGSPAPVPPGPSRVPAAQVILQGRVVDAATGAGIPGTNLYLLKPGVAPRAATRDDVIASAVTDGNGLYQTRQPVARGAVYPVIVLANGYLPVTGTIDLTAAGPEVVTVKTIQLQRQQ